MNSTIIKFILVSLIFTSLIAVISLCMVPAIWWNNYSRWKAEHSTTEEQQMVQKIIAALKEKNPVFKRYESYPRIAIHGWISDYYVGYVLANEYNPSATFVVRVEPNIIGYIDESPVFGEVDSALSSPDTDMTKESLTLFRMNRQHYQAEYKKALQEICRILRSTNL